jgi:hypothetical protein
MTQREREDHKEAYRLFWLVKGHINTTEETVIDSADSYFKRLWVDGCNGAPLYDYEDGFEQAYNRRFHNGIKSDTELR